MTVYVLSHTSESCGRCLIPAVLGIYADRVNADADRNLLEMRLEPGQRCCESYFVEEWKVL